MPKKKLYYYNSHTRQDIVLSLTRWDAKNTLCFFVSFFFWVTHDDVLYDIPFWRITPFLCLITNECHQKHVKEHLHPHTHPLVWACIRVYHTQYTLLIIPPHPHPINIEKIGIVQVRYYLNIINSAPYYRSTILFF